MSVIHLGTCSKHDTLSWPATVDRSKQLSSISYFSDGIYPESPAICKHFMQQFKDSDNERTKIRRVGRSIKSIIHHIEYYTQLGKPVLRFMLTRKFHKKFMYEIYHYCEAPDSSPFNLVVFQNILRNLLCSKSLLFDCTLNRFMVFARLMTNTPRNATLCYQVLSTLAILIDSCDYMLSFCYHYADNDEELIYLLNKVLSNSEHYKELFSSKFEVSIPYGVTLNIHRFNLSKPIQECKKDLKLED